MRLVDLAKKLNVSHSTVSRALNPDKRHLVEESVRNRIAALAEQMHYQPNWMARAMTSKRTHTIGVVLPADLGSIFFNELITKSLAGVFDVLNADARYSCKVLVLPGVEGKDEPHPRTLGADLEGLLISAHRGPYLRRSNYMPPRLNALWNKPAVFLNLEYGLAHGVNVVSFDNRDAAYDAVVYLIKKKHRAIAYLDGPIDMEETRRRRDGYMRALKDHMIPVRHSLVVRCPYKEEGGFSATIKLFRQKGPAPTALFAWDDETAIGALRALEILKKRCPQDVAVVGFDGLLVGDYTRPRLTTVAQPLREMAREGAQLLIDLIEGKVTAPQSRLLPCELIPRDSA
jgi:DNA-binding LacI/PurR family transcriptional regulator